MTTSILIIYLLILIIIAISSSRKIDGYADFFIARKRGTYKSVTGSLVATILGGSAIIGAIDAGDTMGWATSWFMLCAALGLLLLLPMVKNISKLGRFTLPELLHDLHGKKAKTYASYIIPIAWLGIVAAQIIASARILQSFAGIPYETGVIITAVVFTFYTLAGGQISILKTDLLQSVFIVAGMAAIALFTYRSNLPVHHETAVLVFPFNVNFKPIDLIILVVTYATTFTVGPDIYSRIFCAKDHQTARWSIISTALMLIPIAFITGYLSIKGAGIVTHANNASIIDIALNVMPHWLTPFIVIALLSAVLSSADTSMLNSAIILTGLIEKDGYGKNSLLKTRALILAIGVLSMLMALHFTSIIGMLLIALTVYSGSFTLPVIAGLSGVKIKTDYVSAAIVSGGVISLGGKLLTEYTNLSLAGNLIIILSFVINGIILAIGKYQREKNHQRA